MGYDRVIVENDEIPHRVKLQERLPTPAAQTDGVLVKIKNLEETSTPQGGEVVSVGKGNIVKIGDQVVYAGTDMVFEFNGENHVLLEKDDIIGVLETEHSEDLTVLNDRALMKIF
ncbi:20 kDa chaperonin, chloroplastic [Linum perenne]